MPKQRVKLLQCPNCETLLPNAENFCPNCGQENHEIIRPASHLWTELMGNLFNIDSRFFHTMKALLLSPGKLTKEYNAGRRKYYLPPIRIYLLSSVLFFLMQSLTMTLSSEQINRINKKFADNPTDSMNIQIINQTIRLTNAEMLAVADFSDTEMDSFLLNRNVEPTFVNRSVVRQGSKAMNGNVNGITENFQRYLSFAMFIFMPVMGLFLMLFYRKQKRFYVEHLIFSIHFHAVAFFIFTLSNLTNFLPLVIGGVLSLLFILVLAVYQVMSLKNVYQTSWKKAIGVSVGLFFTYGMVVSMGIAGIALLTLLIF